MIIGSHVQTFNHKLASPEQKLHANPELSVKAHSDCFLAEEQAQFV